MEPPEIAELLESISWNELLLKNIFSSMDLDTMKSVRLVNKKWNTVAESRFKEIRRARVHLKFGDNTEKQCNCERKPFLILRSGNDIRTALSDKLASFTHFKLEVTISGEEEKIDEEYQCLSQLLRDLSRPNGSLICFASLLHAIDNIHQSHVPLASIIDACNGFSHLEINPNGFVPPDITGLPKLICNTLRLDRSAVAEDVSNFFTNFNTAKIIVEDASYIDLYGVVQAIVRYGEQFGILQEIDKLAALAALRGLKRLRIRMQTLRPFDSIDLSRDIMSDFQQCLAKHAPTMEVFKVEFIKKRVSAYYRKVYSIEFPKLRELYLETNLNDLEANYVDIFFLSKTVEDKTFREIFPALKKLEIVEPCEKFNPVLGKRIISDLRQKYDVQVVTKYNEVAEWDE
ncbi:hypothetical protein Fcan01_17961 [Folsomia candida]|uniref:F-box domain-containing protein n=1 Tax=Folsomia candida TaxID=158441 RepID=A0A226DR76_FOLCA|nr:hypothetical protein Fcan01_17961 [Folsomia candida]